MFMLPPYRANLRHAKKTFKQLYHCWYFCVFFILPVKALAPTNTAPARKTRMPPPKAKGLPGPVEFLLQWITKQAFTPP
jgi:hypothetical protein